MNKSRAGRLVFIATTLVTFLGTVLAAVAADFVPDPVDRDAAKREGVVSWYTSTPVDAAQKIATMFESETGIKVQLFRSGGSAVLSRFLQERKAGVTAADVLTTSDPAASAALARQGAFVAFRPRNFDKLPATVKDPDGYFVAQRLNMVAIALRGDKVAAADRPKTWSDLTQSKYKGRLVMPDPSFTALQLIVVGTLSQKLGWSFYEGLQKNDIMIVQGNEQVEDMLKRGERDIAAEELDSYADADRKAGHPVATIYPSEGSFAISSPTEIIAGSAHPNAAKAFAEFMIGDAVQKTFPAEGIYAARLDVDPPPGNPKLADIALVPIDYAAIEKNTEAIKTHFNEIFQ
jgi:iron(III) transport system substrate-binding protein